jgi:hypothetical protein
MIEGMELNHKISEYLRQIGRKGGLKSRRTLTPRTAREMVQVREARRVFKKFKVSCFWSIDPSRVIRASDIPWLIDTLRRHGDRAAWTAARALEKYSPKEDDATH